MNTNEVIVNSKVKLFNDRYGYYHLLLKITNRYNSKIYICKHSTKNPYDNYMGSSMYVQEDIRNYGKNAFTKEIIECVETSEILNLYEKSVVDNDFLTKSYTYNINVGGGGSTPKYKTRRGYINELHKKQQKLKDKKQLDKQVIKYIEESKNNSSIEFYIYTLIHNSIQLLNSLFCKIISIGISITQVVKTILF